MSERCRVLLLVGFDRCGSSMISRVLAAHPQVELLFQPFNSTEIHRAQWRAWPPGERHPATERFLDRLLGGEIDRDYLASDWFDHHSSTDRVVPGALHLIKDTKVHFQLPWLHARFPEIPVWGIWRDPRAIVCSLMRNGFHRSWYGDIGVEQLRAMVERIPGLEPYAPMLREEAGEHERMALVVALRTHRFVLDLPADRWLVYEEVVAEPNRALGGFLDGSGLEPFDFAPHLGRDLNVVGRPFEKSELWREFFSAEEIADLDRVFAPLLAARSDRAS